MASKTVVMLADGSSVIADRMEAIVVVPMLRLIGAEGQIDRLSDVCILARSPVVQKVLCTRQGVLDLLISTVWQAVSLVRPEGPSLWWCAEWLHGSIMIR